MGKLPEERKRGLQKKAAEAGRCGKAPCPRPWLFCRAGADWQRQWFCVLLTIMGEGGMRLFSLTAKQRRALVTVAVTAGVYLSFKFLLPLFMPFVVAYLIAVILRPSAAFLERKLRLRFGKKNVCIPIGVIGAVQLILVTVILAILLFYGGRRLFMEINQLLSSIPVWFDSLDEWLTQFCHTAESFCHLEEGVLSGWMRRMLTSAVSALQDAAMPRLVVNSVSVFSFFVEAVVLMVILYVGTILSLQEMDELRHRRHSSVFHREFFLLGRRLAITGSAWLRTQTVILFMTSCVCILGLLAAGIPYYIVGGIGIGLLDALPIFGTGTVLIPWAIILLFQKKWIQGIIILGLYIVCYFLREFAEAKMMGKKMGLSPLETLVSMYIGLKLFGILGFILGPVGLLMIEDLVREYDGEPSEKERGKQTGRDFCRTGMKRK